MGGLALVGGVLLQHLLRATPFEVVYGRPPPAILPVDPTTARTEAVGDLLRSRDEMLVEVRQCLLQAQLLAKHYYDSLIVRQSPRWAIGCGYVFFTALRSH